MKSTTRILRRALVAAIAAALSCSPVADASVTVSGGKLHAVGKVSVGGYNGPVVLTSIVVTPANSTLASATQQYTATGHYTDGTTGDVTNVATWTSSNTAVATVSSTGLVTAGGAGTTTIAAAYQGVSGNTPATVVVHPSGGGMPLCNAAAAGATNTLVRSYYVPSDVTQVQVRMANRMFNNTGSTVAVTTDVAIWTSDGSGGGTGVPTVYSAQVIPGNGTSLLLPLTNITRGVDGKIAVAYFVDAGLMTAYASNTYHGTFSSGVKQVNPLPAVSGTDSNPIFQIGVNYSTARRRIVVLGDSISVGATSVSPASVGFEKSAWYLLGIAKDYAVNIEGLGGGELAEFANPATYPNIYQDANLANSDVVIEVGVNDLSTGSATMISNLTAIVSYLRTQSVHKIYVNTVGPQTIYPGTETARLAYNSFVRTNSLTLDGIFDRAAKQVNGGEADNTDTTILYAPYSSDGTHLSAAGQQAEETAWLPIVN